MTTAGDQIVRKVRVHKDHATAQLESLASYSDSTYGSGLLFTFLSRTTGTVPHPLRMH